MDQNPYSKNVLVDQASDIPSIIFFHNFLQNSQQKLFQFIFIFFYKFTKIRIKSFECPKSIKSIKKNTWNIRLLVDDSFVPLSKQPSVIYCRLTDFQCVIKTKHVAAQFDPTDKNFTIQICYLIFYLIMQIKVATKSEESQKTFGRPYNRLTVMYEMDAISKH